jgi:ABC-2 type transport system permease protein
LIDQVMVVVRRDLATEVSYQYSFAMRYVSIFFSIAIFYFVSLLVGESTQLGEYSGRYFEFALVGLVMSGMTSVSLQTFNQAVGTEMGSGTLEILLATASRYLPIFLGSLVVPILLRFVEAVLYIGLGVGVLGAGFSGRGILLSLPLVLLAIAAFSALGMLASSFVILTKRGDPITGLVAQATNLLAGVLFPISLLPEGLQVVSKLIPTYYALRGVREVLLNGSGFDEVVDEVAVLAGFTVVLVPIALWAFSRAIRLAKQTGTLGTS